MGQHVLEFVGSAPDFLAGRLVKADGKSVAARGDEDSIPIEEGILAGIPAWDRCLVFLDQILLPDQFAGLNVYGMEAAFGIQRKHQASANRRDRPCNAVVGANIDRIAPLLDVLSIGERNAADEVLFFLVIVIVQANPAVLDCRSRIAFADGGFPEYLWTGSRPCPLEAGLRGDIVPVGASKLGPIATQQGRGSQKDEGRQTISHKSNFLSKFYPENH
jgi:hypothetical protein